jgi:hypothetical protein
MAHAVTALRLRALRERARGGERNDAAPHPRFFGRILRLLPLERQYIRLVAAGNAHRHRQGLQIG